MMIVLCVVCLFTFFLFLAMSWRLRFVFGIEYRVLSAESGAYRSQGYYLPMQRLLSESDFQFLAKRSGVPAKSICKLRMERRRLFRGYLASLCMDFAIVSAQIRQVMVVSKVSREDLFVALLKARLVFAAVVFAIECRLLLHSFGFSGLTITAETLTEGLARVRQDLAQITLEIRPELSAATA